MPTEKWRPDVQRQVFFWGGHLSDIYHRHHLRILPQQQMLLCMYLSDVDTSDLRLLSLPAFVVILASLIIPSPVAFSLDSWSFFLAKSSMWLKPELGLISLREK